MPSLKGEPRQVYRVFTEEEYLGCADLRAEPQAGPPAAPEPSLAAEPTCGLPRSPHEETRRVLPASALAALLTGLVGMFLGAHMRPRISRAQMRPPQRHLPPKSVRRSPPTQPALRTRATQRTLRRPNVRQRERTASHEPAARHSRGLARAAPARAEHKRARDRLSPAVSAQARPSRTGASARAAAAAPAEAHNNDDPGASAAADREFGFEG